MKLFWSLEQNSRLLKRSKHHASLHAAECRDVKNYHKHDGGCFKFEANSLREAFAEIYSDFIDESCVDGITEDQYLRGLYESKDTNVCPCVKLRWTHQQTKEIEMTKKTTESKSVQTTTKETEMTKATKTIAKGVATVMFDSAPLFTVTKSEDDTFGWRSHGQMTVVGRDGEKKKAYKFKKGFESAQVAIAAALCYITNHVDVDAAGLEIVDYVEPERKGFSKLKLQDTEKFADALKLAKKLKMPASVKKEIAP